MVLIECAQMPLIIANVNLSSNPRHLNVGLSSHLHPYVVYASSEGSDVSAHMRRHARVFATRQYDKYLNPVHGPISSSPNKLQF